MPLGPVGMLMAASNKAQMTGDEAEPRSPKGALSCCEVSAHSCMFLPGATTWEAESLGLGETALPT